VERALVHHGLRQSRIGFLGAAAGSPLVLLTLGDNPATTGQLTWTGLAILTALLAVVSSTAILRAEHELEHRSEHRCEHRSEHRASSIRPWMFRLVAVPHIIVSWFIPVAFQPPPQSPRSVILVASVIVISVLHLVFVASDVRLGVVLAVGGSFWVLMVSSIAMELPVTMRLLIAACTACSLVPFVAAIAGPLRSSLELELANHHLVNELRIANNELHRTATLDPLTNALNRRGLQLAVENLTGSVSVLYIDLDNFKQVNDRLGHDQGDQLLQRVAETLSACLPTDHILARMGGDEFLVVLCASESLAAVLEGSQAARQVVQAVNAVGHDLGVRATVGCATGVLREELFEDIMRRADNQLYSRKQSSRNQRSRNQSSWNQSSRNQSSRTGPTPHVPGQQPLTPLAL
jgi:diguanylate cyclase (GGDEF)-like protein